MAAALPRSSADKDLQLYVSPVNWRPDAPPLPISCAERRSPASSPNASGYYRTLGWAEATWPLEEGRLDEKAFMDDLYRAFDDRAQVILNRLDARNWDLLVGVIESTDRVQHMMWRLIDPEHPMYDEALAAKVRRRDRARLPALRPVRRRGPASALGPGTPVLIVSDHGFHSWRKAVNLNTWLVQEGFMALKGECERVKKLDDLFGARPVLGARGLVPDPRVRDGARPDLLQPARARGPGHRQPGRRGDGRWPTTSPPGC